MQIAVGKEGKAVTLKENTVIAEQLREAAALMEIHGSNPFRVRAYRRAADTVEALPQTVDEILHSEGYEGLTALPGIGDQIADSIVELIRTGRWMQLERLRGVRGPESLLSKVPGIGPELARRIAKDLQIDSLESLEIAAHDGRLQRVDGFGPRRLAMVRGALAEMLARRTGRRASGEEPPAAVLLDVDREYREKAAAHRLRVITPRRFNPRHEAWLPVLETTRGPWHFTALYSNTALAHRLGRTRNWVVISFVHDSGVEGQRTVVTETQGVLIGERVVRGREEECAAWYAGSGANGSNAA